MNIVQVSRRPFAGQFSIEGQFDCLRAQMQRAGSQTSHFVVPYCSKGIVRRALNCWSACRQRADVYHVTGDIHYAAMFLPGDRTVLTIHDCGTLERLRGIKRWLLKTFWFDLPIRRARYITVISEETKRQLQHHVSVAGEKIHVVPDVVSPVYQPYARPFNGDCPRILQIGTKDNKNLIRLAEALRGIRCHLHIVGRLSDRQRCSLQECGVDFSSECDLSEAAMYDCYCAADIVSFVSTYEGFGLPIVEANAVGRPVVTSNVSSMPEVAGRAACLVDPFDVDSIRSGIRLVVDEPEYRDGLVRAGFENVKRFRADAVAEQYLSLYGRVARQGVPSPAVSPVSAGRA